MDTNFVAPIDNLEINVDLGRGQKITEEIFLTNNRSVIKGLIPKDLRDLLGPVATDDFENAPVVVYATDKSSNTTKIEQELSFYAQLNMTHIELLLHLLWITKDHSSILRNAYAFNGTDYFFGTSNEAGRSKADAVIGTTLVTQAELKKARELFRKSFTQGKPYSGGVTSFHKNNSNRLTRALAHVSAAQNSRDLAFKIASYCSSLECLFSTDNTELTHQLSERVSFLLHEAPSQRRATFDAVKDAYGIRSKTLHGVTISDGVECLRAKSILIDEIVRQSIQVVFDNADLETAILGSNDNLRKYFLNLIIGC